MLTLLYLEHFNSVMLNKENFSIDPGCDPTGSQNLCEWQFGKHRHSNNFLKNEITTTTKSGLSMAYSLYTLPTVPFFPLC